MYTMSLAIGHFAIGVGSTLILLVVTGLYKRPTATGLAILGGLWAMLPDIHWVLPHADLASAAYMIHGHAVADVFFFHTTMDAIDATDSRVFAGKCVLLMCIVGVVYAGVRYHYFYTSGAGADTAELNSHEYPRKN